MALSYVRIADAQRDLLVEFFCGEEWAFHSNPWSTPEQVRAWWNRGVFTATEAAWSTASELFDSVGYAILRRDWEAGTTTPVEWDS